MRRCAPLLLLLVVCQRSTPSVATVPTVPAGWRFPVSGAVATGEHAILVTEEPLATHVGLEVLRAGGNAVDAAVATAFALAVTYPVAGNLGGGGFAVVRTADGKTYALDFRETAPLGATRDMYLDAQGKPTEDSVVGPRAAGVPGSVAGLWALHGRLGSKPWAELLAPAIRLAEDGFPVSERFHKSIVDEGEEMRRFPASAAQFFPGGEPPAVGATFKNPDLARTLRRIAEHGADGFYLGETAELVAEEMRRSGGVITREDLAGYRAKWRDPIEFDYRGYHVISMPPPSSGGIALAEIAHILAGYDLAALGWHSVEHVHLVAEAIRRAFADRNALLGDPDFVPWNRSILTDGYAKKRRETIDLHKASRSDQTGPGFREGTDTTHFAVVDEKGNVVALTYTLNRLYGSGVTVAGAGFLLNDEMDDFAAKPGTPNSYGLVQGEANAVGPGKRPLSSMSPTIVVDRGGRVVLVTGARGGSRIITAVFQVMSNALDFGMDAYAAVATPRVHHQHLPDLLFVEPEGLPSDTLRALERLGHATKAGGSGVAPTIVRRGNTWTAAPDPRRGGAAEGY
jgi:gamma-glutamyltranspeptidase/glutathione hydrolase